MNIQIDKFKDYKVVKNPKAAQIIDNSVNQEWWNNEGWSTMYDSTPEEFKKMLPTWDRKLTRGLESLSFKQPSEETDKLQKIFDFLEKKEGKPNPLKAEGETNEIFSDPKALYVGKLGFGYINDRGKVEVFPYPASGIGIEQSGELKNYIIDVKDGGIVVWDNPLKNLIYNKEEEYII